MCRWLQGLIVCFDSVKKPCQSARTARVETCRAYIRPRQGNMPPASEVVIKSSTGLHQTTCLVRWLSHQRRQVLPPMISASSTISSSSHILNCHLEVNHRGSPTSLYLPITYVPLTAWLSIFFLFRFRSC